jgi:hypothetical protein
LRRHPSVRRAIDRLSWCADECRDRLVARGAVRVETVPRRFRSDKTIYRAEPRAVDELAHRLASTVASPAAADLNAVVSATLLGHSASLVFRYDDAKRERGVRGLARGLKETGAIIDAAKALPTTYAALSDQPVAGICESIEAIAWQSVTRMSDWVPVGGGP